MVESDHRVAVPVDEFKAVLDDFCLVDNEDTNASAKITAMIAPANLPHSRIKMEVREVEGESTPLAEIGIDAPTWYLSNRQNGARTFFYVARLHPATQLYLRELVAKHFPDG